MVAALLSVTFVTARLAPAAPPPRTEPYKNPRSPKNPNHLHLQPLSPSSSSSSSAASASSCALQCPHFQSCSGCTHEWDLDRPQVLEEVSKFFKDRGVANFSFDIGRLWEWRCRAKLAIRGTPEIPLVGLYQEGTHCVVDIPQCRGISKLNIQPFDEDLGTGELRYVQMAVTTYNTSLPAAERYREGKVQVSLVWNSRNEHAQNSEKLKALSDFLWRNGGPNGNIHLIHSVWANFQTSSSNIIFGNKWRHLIGERDFWEHIGGIDVSLDPSSFGQANTQAFCSLLRKLQKYVPRGSSVVDLYSGAGAIGLSVAATRKCRSVKCIEINKESKASFEKSVSRLPKTVDCSINWHNTDASIEPVHWLEGLIKASKAPKSSILNEKEERDPGFYVQGKQPFMLMAKPTGKIVKVGRQPLSISVVDGKVLRRIVRTCYQIMHGIWRKLMLSTFSLALRGIYDYRLVILDRKFVDKNRLKMSPLSSGVQTRSACCREEKEIGKKEDSQVRGLENSKQGLLVYLFSLWLEKGDIQLFSMVHLLDLASFFLHQYKEIREKKAYQSKIIPGKNIAVAYLFWHCNFT
uniref:Methyltransferase small domain-containing protein n=1 Tax=Ananas comosus var. bracteatus TaxID=296719 RepID=A0A6V7QTC9_ANACO